MSCHALPLSSPRKRGPSIRERYSRGMNSNCVAGVYWVPAFAGTTAREAATNDLSTHTPYRNSSPTILVQPGMRSWISSGLRNVALKPPSSGRRPALHRRHARHRRQIVGLLQHALAVLRGEEIDQESRRVRMRRVLEDADGVERDRHRLHLDPVRWRALLGADHGVMVEHHQAHRIFAGDHLIEDRARGGLDVDDALRRRAP